MKSEVVGDVRLGAGVQLGDGCRLLALGGPIVIGDATVLGDRCRLVAHERIEVGPGCRLADEVVIQDFAPVYDDVERPIRSQGLRTAPVVVGDGARLGARACLGPGARVPPGATIGAHVVIDPSWPDPDAAETPDARAGEPAGAEPRSNGTRLPGASP